MLHASLSEHLADGYIHILTKDAESSVTLKDWFTTLQKLDYSGKDIRNTPTSDVLGIRP